VLAAPVHFPEGIVKRLELEAVPEALLVQKGQEVSLEALVQKDLVV